MTFSGPRSEVRSRRRASAPEETARRRTRVEESLPRFLSPEVCDIPARLREAIEYSLTSGGKRIRPVVLLSAGAAVGGDEEQMLPFACAVEYVHTYSLIHDDLPAMDDDDFRRGRPSCHKAFGEAGAILAGDALLAEAFRVMGESALASRDPGRAVRAMAMLARASGASGMAGGQMLDLAGGAASPARPAAEEIDLRKTAALLSAAAAMGGVLGGASGSRVDALARYGRELGVLFQVTDDMLDETGRFEEMGKAVAKDRGRGKVTFLAEHGMDAAVAKADSLLRGSIEALSGFGAEADPLREIARIVAARRS